MKDELSESFTALFDQVVSQLHVDSAAVLLYNPPTEKLEYAAGRGFRTKNIELTSLGMGTDYAGRAALERKIIHIPDLKEDKSKSDRAELITSESFVGYCGVPLIAKDQILGVLEVFHRAPLIADPEWISFLQVLAERTALAIDNALLFNNLQRSNLELAQAYDATIEGWVLALDLRDRELEGHTLRVTELSLRLARELGIKDEELVHIRRGALLHDIGKLGIPDTILFKPGPLTEEEQQVMRRHPVLGYTLLSPIQFLRPALDIVYCHHENWDGSGYPRGLKGEDIPRTARIFSVANVWDVLVADRPFRPGSSKDEAIAYIKDQAGKQFDPQVVNAFLTVISD